MKARLHSICAAAALLTGGWPVWQAQPAAAQTPELIMATIFGPVSMRPTESLRTCSNNLFGTNPVILRVTILDALTGAVAGVPQELKVPAGGGVCATNPSNDKMPETAVVVLSISAASLGWGNDRRVLSNSVQLVDAESRSSVFLPSMQMSSAVEFPRRQ